MTRGCSVGARRLQPSGNGSTEREGFSRAPIAHRSAKASAERTWIVRCSRRGMRLRRPPRLPKPSYRGPQRIFLTMCTFERRPYFTSDARVDLVHREFLRSTHICDVEATAYCFMP